MRRAMLTVMTCALVFHAAPAFADRPITVRESWEEHVRCGDVVGVASGTVVQRIHLHEKGDGSVTFVYNEQAHESTFVDSDGNVYRVVGSGSGSGQWEPDFVLERKMLNLQIIGPRGKLGDLRHNYHGGEWTESGSCVFL